MLIANLVMILSLFGALNNARVSTGDALEYRLLATNKTSTMQKEMSEAGRAGFVFCGMTVAETSFGGREVVSIMRRQAAKELR